MSAYHDHRSQRKAQLQDYSVSFSRRPEIQSLIGEQAEFLVHTFCVMDLASLDATMDAPSGKHHVMARKQHGGQPIPLTDQQYRDLITVQLADWLEQVHCALHTRFCHFQLMTTYSTVLEVCQPDFVPDTWVVSSAVVSMIMFDATAFTSNRSVTTAYLVNITLVSMKSYAMSG